MISGIATGGTNDTKSTHIVILWIAFENAIMFVEQ